MIGFGQRIDTEKMIELRDGHLIGTAVNESTTAQHIVIVQPLRSISLKVYILSRILNLAAGRAVLTEIIRLSGCHNVELGQSIMEAMFLTLSQIVLLGKDSTETLLGT